MSETLKRRPDLDRPPIKMPCNDVILPQQVAFETEDGGIVEMSRDMVNALGIYGQVKALVPMDSGRYVKKLWERMRNEKAKS